jgi:hypothetical protein
MHALNYCMLLPGPEAQQLATYIGWLMHKTKGHNCRGFIYSTISFSPGRAFLDLCEIWKRPHHCGSILRT